MAVNYGAVLQAFALAEYCKSLGHDVRFSRYPHLERHLNVRETYRFNSAKEAVLSILKIVNLRYFFGSKKRRYYFKKFIEENFQFRDDDEADVLVHGSDQIWNDQLFSHDWFYSVGKKTRKISYAASFGKPFDAQSAKHAISRLDKTWAQILLRENDYCSAFRSWESEVVCDPVLLMDKKFWSQDLKVTSSEAYTFVYVVSPPAGFSKRVEILTSINSKVYEILTRPYKRIRGSLGDYSLDVMGFVDQISGCSKVVTSSYHAFVFALIFEKPVHVFFATDRGSRFVTLADLLDLQITDSGSGCSEIVIDEPNYPLINSKLAEFRNNSRVILESALEKC